MAVVTTCETAPQVQAFLAVGRGGGGHNRLHTWISRHIAQFSPSFVKVLKIKHV